MGYGKLIGRKEEMKLLQSLQNRNRSDFVAVFGRRRVGKTFLIRTAFEGQFAFHIGGVVTRSSAWLGDDGTRKAQIDLVIDRRDGVINVCEMKFSTGTFTITKAYATELREKISLFKEVTKTRKAVYLTMMTTYGLTRNHPETGLVQNELTMDVLFV